MDPYTISIVFAMVSCTNVLEDNYELTQAVFIYAYDEGYEQLKVSAYCYDIFDDDGNGFYNNINSLPLGDMTVIILDTPRDQKWGHAGVNAGPDRIWGTNDEYFTGMIYVEYATSYVESRIDMVIHELVHVILYLKGYPNSVFVGWVHGYGQSYSKPMLVQDTDGKYHKVYAMDHYEQWLKEKSDNTTWLGIRENR